MSRHSSSIIDILDEDSFALLPPCIDPRFDHRSCDYWEDDERGSKAARPTWWQGPASPATDRRAPTSQTSHNPFVPPQRAANPFAPDPAASAASNPFAPGPADQEPNPFAAGRTEDMPNPFAPLRGEEHALATDAPRKLRLLDRGRRVFGAYAKVLLIDDRPAAYVQFGPLSAYPRARRMRELYPRLPSAPLPAVITCIASSPESRGRGFARELVLAVCDDLSARGFAAVESFPDLTLGPTEASAAIPAFWEGCGFSVAMDDERFPVMRRELA
jgi:ribosomal protein S18 acetylase RimI-like enzyme